MGESGEITFGDYVVIDELGRGGMGTVLKAQHRRMEREVAIKILPVAALDSELAVARFYQEVKVAAQLTHPNIVHAYDAGEHQGFHYLVMEYVRGKDLSKLIADGGALGLGDALDYVIQAATGLQYAHRKGVVHRDIKPSNLLLDDENTIKVLDMGLARIGGSGLEQNASMHLTSTGQVMGTVDYMAPEQAEDTRNADHRSDIYSLGCTLFRFVTGTAPFSRDTVVKTILAHREDPIPALGRGQGTGSQQLESVFQMMVAKRPEDRFQDCQHLIEQLQLAKAQVSSAHEEQTIQFTNNGGKSAPPVVGPPSDPGPISSPTVTPGSTAHSVGPPTSDPDSPTLAPQQASHQAGAQALFGNPADQDSADQDPASTPSTTTESELELIEELVEIEPHRAKKLLKWSIICAVLAFTCVGIPGIGGVAILAMSYGDLRRMNEGKMDDRGRSTLYGAIACSATAIVLFAGYVLAGWIGAIRD